MSLAQFLYLLTVTAFCTATAPPLAGTRLYYSWMPGAVVGSALTNKDNACACYVRLNCPLPDSSQLQGTLDRQMKDGTTIGSGGGDGGDSGGDVAGKESQNPLAHLTDQMVVLPLRSARVKSAKKPKTIRCVAQNKPP
ncbi:hypothetical protein PoB_001820800 [Plakobranchus ocellatus]|uniref:Uncharacterized protein n=1 Tax=Plakobranchus ocellatus TaxID=259542 RepID=A0AAV3ZBA2_9GAST|nr:hypothetical protein PoB_001820800 [Plakobranchus ocellatus]